MAKACNGNPLWAFRFLPHTAARAAATGAALWSPACVGRRATLESGTFRAPSAIFQRMPRALRQLMLLASFLTLQFTLVSGGAGCLMSSESAVPSGATSAARQNAAMAAMDMGDVDTPSSDDASSSSNEAPCDESSATVTCPTMAPCATAALPLPAQIASTASALDSSNPASLRPLAPPSVSAAPELPPPRA